MKLPVTIATIAMLLTPLACDDGKEKVEPKAAKTDQAAAKGDDAKVEAPVAAGRVFFVAPADGATLPEQFEVEFGVEGKQVEPAGAVERDPASGHHHLLIDTGPIADMVIVPKDETHLHYGDGATKATVKLPPGKHTLTMQFADGAHRSYGEDWATTITVEVQAGEAAAGADAAAPAPGEAG